MSKLWPEVNFFQAGVLPSSCFFSISVLTRLHIFVTRSHTSSIFTFQLVYIDVSGGHPTLALLDILSTPVKRFNRMSLVGKIYRPIAPVTSRKIGRDVSGGEWCTKRDSIGLLVHCGIDGNGVQVNRKLALHSGLRE